MGISSALAPALQRRGIAGVHVGFFLAVNLVLLGALGGSAAAIAIGIVVIPYAFRSPASAVQALTISWLLGHLNSGMFRSASAIGALRWVLLFVCAGRIVLELRAGRARLPFSLGGVVVFIVVVATLSFTASYMPALSIAKLVAFALASSTILIAYVAPPPKSSAGDYWKEWFATLFATILLWSLPTYLLGVGFHTNGRGFQGILNQPQAFGIFLAPVAAWYTGQVLFGRPEGRWVYGLAGVSWMALFASGSRTSLGAVVIGFGLVLALLPFARREDRRSLVSMLRRRSTIGIMALAVALLAIVWSQLAAEVGTFLAKGEATGVSAETFEASRGMLILQSLENFQQHPWTGIGFGLASDPAQLEVQRDPLLNLPISASVEKGFLPTALVEEVGLIGAAAFILMIAWLVRDVIRQGDFALAWMFLAALATNIGEVTIFSPGGMGLFFWLVMGMVVSRRYRSSSSQPGHA